MADSGGAKTDFVAYHVQNLIQHSMDAVISYDCQLRVTEWSPLAAKLFGREAIDVIGKNVLDTVTSLDRMSTDLQDFKSVLDGRVVFRAKVPRQNAEGHWFTSAFKAFPVYDKDGVVRGATILMRDETDRVHTGQLLGEMEEVAQSACWQYFPGEHILRFSPYAANLFGEDYYKWTTLPDFCQHFTMETRDRFQQAINNSLQTGEPGSETVVRSENDRDLTYQIKWNAEVINDKVVRIFGIVADISDDVQLKSMVKQQETQLLAKNRLSAIGEMAAGVAHEINNPLAVATGCIEMLKDCLERNEEMSEEYSNLLSKIDRSTNRITRIIRGLLDFSRERQADQYTVETVERIMEDALEFCNARLNHAGIHLVVKGMEEPFEIVCRPTEISQVFLNILNNAHDALLEHQVKNPAITVQIGKTMDGWTSLQFSNNGPPIPETVRQKVFQPFFTTKDVGKGTGLGLSICYGIIKEHKGNLYLDSSSRYVNFVIEFPPADAASELLSEKDKVALMNQTDNRRVG